MGIKIAVADEKSDRGAWIYTEHFRKALQQQGLPEFEAVPCDIGEAAQQAALERLGASSWPDDTIQQLGRIGLRILHEAKEALAAQHTEFGASSFVIADFAGKDKHLSLAVIADKYGRRYVGCFPAVTQRPTDGKIFFLPNTGTCSSFFDSLSTDTADKVDVLDLPHLDESVWVNATRCALEALRPKTPAL